jgi:ferric enterobactin receptor
VLVLCVSWKLTSCRTTSYAALNSRQQSCIYSNAYNFNDGWRLNADLNINSKNLISLQGSRNGYAGTSFNVNKELIKNKLNFSAGIKNPFAKYRYDITYTNGPDLFKTALTSNITGRITLV